MAVPAVTAAYAYIKRRPTQTAFFFWYALILFAVWYTSRYFNNSHLAFISTLLGISALKSGDGRKV
ncbi:hypothetical protein A2Z33_02905 [Candidatus Gottesmanbacteria bacterium RBG_16_52_11]|uniref:Uncharacterized protein n=1 Tax=Candidatus Gottesmanbacteria bacterium RBG_16_52_11 TaxID=1798374 RepID=A0A1F5YMZ1_9BACT|nr:MAG: hypothetical protein A2Z33_02905 [Candidatus Gottesmanbacteria bacterium RBG_16_52_11]